MVCKRRYRDRRAPSCHAGYQRLRSESAATKDTRVLGDRGFGALAGRCRNGRRARPARLTVCAHSWLYRHESNAGLRRLPARPPEPAQDTPSTRRMRIRPGTQFDGQWAQSKGIQCGPGATKRFQSKTLHIQPRPREVQMPVIQLRLAAFSAALAMLAATSAAPPPETNPGFSPGAAPAHPSPARRFPRLAR